MHLTEAVPVLFGAEGVRRGYQRRSRRVCDDSGSCSFPRGHSTDCTNCERGLQANGRGT